MFLIVAHNFGSHHHLFIIFTHIQLSHYQYPPFFYFHPVLVHGHLMITQIDISMIILHVWLFSNIFEVSRWNLSSLLICHFEWQFLVIYVFQFFLSWSNILSWMCYFSTEVPSTFRYLPINHTQLLAHQWLYFLGVCMVKMKIQPYNRNLSVYCHHQCH